MVNSAVVSYFMENLKLVDHFETLKKFLFMEDGEFSFSLTQQLFEKVSCQNDISRFDCRKSSSCCYTVFT